MVRDRLAQPDCARGFLLDGYPRTLQQVKEPDTLLTDLGGTLYGVILLTADEELVRRLLQRARLEGRADDTEVVIRRRQEIYLAQTAPLAKEYEGRGLLAEVDGSCSVDQVTDRLHDAIGRLHGRSTSLCAQPSQVGGVGHYEPTGGRPRARTGGSCCRWSMASTAARAADR
jgi:hypothetical protein